MVPRRVVDPSGRGADGAVEQLSRNTGRRGERKGKKGEGGELAEGKKEE